MQALTSVETVHDARYNSPLGRCKVVAVGKLNTQEEERNPDELIMFCGYMHMCRDKYIHSHPCTCYILHRTTQKPVTSFAQTYVQRQVRTPRPSRTQTHGVLWPYRFRCPAFNGPSYSPRWSRPTISLLLFATIQKSKMWKTRSPPNTDLISWFN